MPDTPKDSRPLHLQTIDSLFAELLGGASISVGKDNVEFRLDNADSRAILNWYRLNRTKWASKIRRASCREMVCQIVEIEVVAVAIKKKRKKTNKENETQ